MIDEPALREAHQARPGEVDVTAGLLFALAERTRRSFEAVAARFDLTPVQARALLGLEEAVRMRSLAEHLHCDASNVTGIADRLEARGLVVREPAAGDRRVKLLALTPEGARVRQQLEDAVAGASPITTDLDVEEREALRALLRKAVSGFEPQAACGPDHGERPTRQA